MKRRWMMACVPLALAGCGSRREAPDVRQPWVRLAAVPGRPAAAYFTASAGDFPQTLTKVSAPSVGRAEMHETMTSGPMTAMAPLAAVAIPKHGSVAFAPGGRHVMLFDVDPSVRPGGEIVLHLRFAGGGEATGRAKVVGAGDPAPY